jgi:hypothetical protein
VKSDGPGRPGAGAARYRALSMSAKFCKELLKFLMRTGDGWLDWHSLEWRFTRVWLLKTSV